MRENSGFFLFLLSNILVHLAAHVCIVGVHVFSTYLVRSPKRMLSSSVK